MIIKSLKIENFRCFKSFETEFAPKVSVLIGKNGAGKTSLVNSITKAISFIFTNSGKVSDHFLAAGNPTLGVNSIETTDFYYDSTERVTKDKASIKGVAEIGKNEVEWELYKHSTKNANLYASKYKDAYRQFMSEYDETGILPVLSVYSDSFPHRKSKVHDNAQKQLMKPHPARNWGYYMWDDESACLGVWLSRLDDILQNKTTLEGILIKEQGKSEVSDEYIQEIKNKLEPLAEEVSYIEGILKKFSKLINIEGEQNFEVDYLLHQGKGKYSDVYIHFKDGSSKTFDSLPAGFKRIYSIVLDIAYRSYIINGPVDVQGIVVIDEVDLHLHPGLEAVIVNCLTATFPFLQFILTTHSPLVVSNIDTREQTINGCEGLIRQNAVYYIKPGLDKSKSLFDAFGNDFNTTLEDVMDVQMRSEDLENKIGLCITYRLQGDKESSNRVYKEIESRVGCESMKRIAAEIRRRYFDLKEQE